jgi:cytoskeletal protein CcmA (bactofilin family)
MGFSIMKVLGFGGKAAASSKPKSTEVVVPDIPVPTAAREDGLAIDRSVATRPEERPQKITSLVGEGGHFEGLLRTVESLHISGTVLGSIEVGQEGAAASLSSKACVIGKVVADNVLVGGHIKGEVMAKTLRIFKGGVVEGDVYCERLLIDDGGNLFGQSHRYGSQLIDAAATPVVEKPSGGAQVFEMGRGQVAAPSVA